jgi:CubicO group peptidase (beta-lactamase class C family)
VGSVSKLWAMTLFLAEAGIDTFSDPVAKYIPEIQSAVSGDAIDSVQWANVTIGDLASHLAGVGRDCMSAFPLPRREILRKIPLLTILLFRWHP